MLQMIHDNAQSISAVVAFFAIFLSIFALFTTASVARTQVHLELRKRFAEINNQIPRGEKDYHDDKWWPNAKDDPKNFELIEKYWFHTFDEWFITTKLDHWRFNRLWKVFHKRAVYEGLKNVPIRYVLFYITNIKRTSFSGLGEEFLSDMSELYREYTKSKATPNGLDIFAGFVLPGGEKKTSDV